MKILIVDDSRVSRMFVRKSLPERIKETAEFREGDDGEQAVAIYKEWRPDLVLLDLTMPGMTGYEALEAIIEFDADARVVIVSADIQQSAVERVMRLGALTHINKPPEPDKMDSLFVMLESGQL
jgi:two-component system chemotaxis response regulator CheY